MGKLAIEQTVLSFFITKLFVVVFLLKKIFVVLFDFVLVNMAIRSVIVMCFR